MDVLESVPVVCDHLSKSVDSRVEHVSIECEAVRRTPVVGRHRTAESVQIDVLVRVVVLQDRAYLLDYLKVLVALRVEKVQ